MQQAEELVELAARKNLRIMVDHTFLFTGAVRKIRELIDKGALGPLYYFDSSRINLGLFQHDVSVVWDLAPHDLSIMDYVIGAKAEAVVATGGSHFNRLADMAFLTIYFPDNVIAHINVNWLSPVKVRMTMIGGRDKMLVWNDLEADEKIKVYDKGVTVTNREGVYDLLVSYRSGDVWAPKVDQTEALKAELAYFVECVAGGTTPFNDGEAGLRVVRMLEAADQSLAERGKVVQLSCSPPSFPRKRESEVCPRESGARFPRTASFPRSGIFTDLIHPLVDYFRCPEHLAVLGTADPLPLEAGYFRFGERSVYGRQAVGAPSPRPDGGLVDVSRGVSSAEGRGAPAVRPVGGRRQPAARAVPRGPARD